MFKSRFSDQRAALMPKLRRSVNLHLVRVALLAMGYIPWVPGLDEPGQPGRPLFCFNSGQGLSIPLMPGFAERSSSREPCRQRSGKALAASRLIRVSKALSPS